MKPEKFPTENSDLGVGGSPPVPLAQLVNTETFSPDVTVDKQDNIEESPDSEANPTSENQEGEPSERISADEMSELTGTVPEETPLPVIETEVGKDTVEQTPEAAETEATEKVIEQNTVEEPDSAQGKLNEMEENLKAAQAIHEKIPPPKTPDSAQIEAAKESAKEFEVELTDEEATDLLKSRQRQVRTPPPQREETPEVTKTDENIIEPESEEEENKLRQEEIRAGKAAQKATEDIAVETPETEFNLSPEEQRLRDTRTGYAEAQIERQRVAKKQGLSRVLKDQKLIFDSKIRTLSHFIQLEDPEILEGAKDKAKRDLTDEEKAAKNRKEEFINTLKEKDLKPKTAEAIYFEQIAKAKYDEVKIDVANKLKSEKHIEAYKELVEERPELNDTELSDWDSELISQLDQKTNEKTVTEVFQKIILEEQELLEQAKAEALPEKEKGIFKKAWERWNTIDRKYKIAISVTAAGTLGFLSGGAAIALTTGGISLGRCFLSALAGKGAFVGADKIIKKWEKTKGKEKTKESKTQKLEEESGEVEFDSLNDFLSETEEKYQTIVEEAARREKLQNWAKIGAAVGAGLLVGKASTAFGGGIIESTGATNAEILSGKPVAEPPADSETPQSVEEIAEIEAETPPKPTEQNKVISSEDKEVIPEEKALEVSPVEVEKETLPPAPSEVGKTTEVSQADAPQPEQAETSTLKLAALQKNIQEWIEKNQDATTQEIVEEIDKELHIESDDGLTPEEAQKVKDFENYIEQLKNNPNQTTPELLNKVIKEHYEPLLEKAGQRPIISIEKQIELGTIGKGEGVEHAFIRQLKENPAFWGYDGDMTDPSAVKGWAGDQAHRIAIDNEYVDPSTGKEIRVLDMGKPGADDNPAYVLEKQTDGKITVKEYLEDKPTGGEGELNKYEYEEPAKDGTNTTPTPEPPALATAPQQAPERFAESTPPSQQEPTAPGLPTPTTEELEEKWEQKTKPPSQREPTEPGPLTPSEEELAATPSNSATTEPENTEPTLERSQEIPAGTKVNELAEDTRLVQDNGNVWVRDAEGSGSDANKPWKLEKSTMGFGINSRKSDTEIQNWIETTDKNVKLIPPKTDTTQGTIEAPTTAAETTVEAIEIPNIAKKAFDQGVKVLLDPVNEQEDGWLENMGEVFKQYNPASANEQVVKKIAQGLSESYRDDLTPDKNLVRIILNDLNEKVQSGNISSLKNIPKDILNKSYKPLVNVVVEWSKSQELDQDTINALTDLQKQINKL